MVADEEEDVVSHRLAWRLLHRHSQQLSNSVVAIGSWTRQRLQVCSLTRRCNSSRPSTRLRVAQARSHRGGSHIALVCLSTVNRVQRPCAWPRRSRTVCSATSCTLQQVRSQRTATRSTYSRTSTL